VRRYTTPDFIVEEAEEPQLVFRAPGFASRKIFLTCLPKPFLTIKALFTFYMTILKTAS